MEVSFGKPKLWYPCIFNDLKYNQRGISNVKFRIAKKKNKK